MKAAIIIGVLIGIGVAIYSSVVFDEIVHMKGYSDGKYAWMCLLFGPVGWAMVIALPDRGKAAAEKPAKPAADELPDI